MPRGKIIGVRDLNFGSAFGTIATTRATSTYMRVCELREAYGALTGRDLLDDYDDGLNMHIVQRQLEGRPIRVERGLLEFSDRGCVVPTGVNLMRLEKHKTRLPVHIGEFLDHYFTNPPLPPGARAELP